LWPDLARTLERRRQPRRRHYAIAAALAAGIALVVAMPRMHRDAPSEDAPKIATTSAPAPAANATAANTNVDVPAASSGDGAELDRLHGRSQSLERWIAAFAASAPQDSRDLMAAVEIEDLIGLVDVQLGAPHDDGEALPLWRKRVALLEDLATIRGNGFAIAANDRNAGPAASQLLN
jgi:hypothetical protein